MGKLTWIIVAVLLFLLFRDKIGQAADAVTGRRSTNPSDYYYGPPPGQNYYTSPPSSRPTTVTDIVNNLISAGTQIWNGYSPSDPGGGPVDYSASANYND